MRQQIPLQGGAVNAHQIVTVQLGDNLVRLHFNYLQSGQWLMDLEREGVYLVRGAILEPNCDVIAPWRLENDIGYLVFTGAATTLDNLGTDNTLVWVSTDE